MTFGNHERELRDLEPKLRAAASSLRPRSSGIDADDLVQVGLIEAWERMVEGKPISLDILTKRMRNEIRRDARTAGKL